MSRVDSQVDGSRLVTVPFAPELDDGSAKAVATSDVSDEMFQVSLDE